MGKIFQPECEVIAKSLIFTCYFPNFGFIYGKSTINKDKIN